MTKTIGEMTAEIREVNVEKGWRPAEGGPGENTWGDYIALLHSEVSEALDAYRDHRLADATEVCTSEGGEGGCDIHGHVPFKPEGVGSELADVLIRLLDMCDVFGKSIGNPYCSADQWSSSRLSDLESLSAMEDEASFGDYIAEMHSAIARMDSGPWAAHYVPLFLVAMSRHFGIDLDAEYERKVAYNRTRSFQHDGRTLAGKKGSA